MQIHPESIAIYKDIKRSEYPIFEHKVKIRIQMDYSPKVTIEVGDYNVEPYEVQIRDSSGNILYQSKLESGFNCYAFRRWVDNFDIYVYDSERNQVAHFNLFEKLRTGKVIVAFESSSLGDTLAFFPYLNKFAETHNCSDLTVTTFWNHLFETQYPNIKFQYPGFREDGIDVLIGMGWYEEEDRNIHKKDPRLCNLQEIAADILGVEYAGDIRPKLPKVLSKRPTESKYVCIGTESTAAAKHWNYPGGWQKLVDMLRESGYEVVLIHRQGNNLKNVIDKSGEIDIKYRISDLLQCEFFIGVSSGLSWLSWGLNVPTVVISGFTHKFCEFSDNTLRIINEEVCHGCFNNINYKFDRGDWWWCPANKNTERHFECTKSITPEHVHESIINWRSQF